MRRVWIAGALISLSGCDKPVISGCENFIKETLKAPSTYKRLDVSESDELKSYKEMVRLGMNDNAGQLAALLKVPIEQFATQKNLHTVLVTYEAKNSYNVPLKGEAICAFSSDSKESLPDSAAVKSLVSGALSANALRNLKEASGDMVAPAPAYSCCL